MRPRIASKNTPFLNHPLWLVASSTSCSSESQEVHTEILCKRISWIVAQTIARQLVSVVNTSIWEVALAHMAEQALNGIGSTARDVPGALWSSHKPLQQNPRQVSLNRA